MGLGEKPFGGGVVRKSLSKGMSLEHWSRCLNAVKEEAFQAAGTESAKGLRWESV